jgi:hypothetical protein
LNLALLALALAAGWQVRVRWLAAKERERAVLRSNARTALPVEAAPGRPPGPASAAAYSDVAQKLLFARDRNPNVTVEAAPPKPVPPFPLAFGVVDFGGGPVVMLSDKAGAAGRPYSPGDKVGEFVLQAVSADSVVLEWEGQTFTKRLEELRPKAPAPAAGAPAEAAASPVSAPVQSASTTAKATGPGADAGGGIRACDPGDASAPGTVRDGYRKVVTQTPFGMSCRWEPVQ